MLLKNDEIYHLTMADQKAINTRFRKFPIRLVYPADRIKKSRSKHNTLPDQPTSISFPLSATVKTKNGAVQWRYAENKIIGEHGIIKWTPHNLILRGSISLTETDKELIWWLWKACPVLEGGDNYNGRKAKCAFEDLVGAAEKKAMKEERITTMKALIYSSKVGLGEERLRQVAKAYFIPEVDDMTFSQVKLMVENQVHRNKATGLEYFLHLVEAESELEVRSTIQKAIDGNVVTFLVETKQWAWVIEHGRKKEPFIRISAGANPQEALYDYYKGDRQFAESLAASIKGSKVILTDSR